MAIVFKEETTDRLVVERRENVEIQLILFLPLGTAVLFVLLLLIIARWLAFNNLIETVLLTVIGIAIALLCFLDFEMTKSMLRDFRQAPQVIRVDLPTNLATGLTLDYVTKKPQSWRVELDRVNSIDLTIDDPRFNLWTLDLQVSDGSSVRMFYGARADLLLAAQKIAALVHKPIKDSNDWKP